MGFVIDQKREPAWAGSQDLLEALFSSAPDAVMIMDQLGQIGFLNRAAEELFGYTADEVLGKPFDDLVADGLTDTNLRAGRLRISGRHRNGTLIPLEVGVSQADVAGATLLTAILRDATVARQTEAALREEPLARHARELERSNAELEQFAYVASHDLQQPLRTVASYAELLAERYLGLLDERADRWITYVVDGVNRMQRLIDDLLALAQVHTHGGAFVETDCAALVRRTWEQIRQEYPVEARLEQNDLPTVIADAGQLEQLFQNLLDNALKYSRPHVPLEVQVSAMPAGHDPTIWEFTVRDNGIGLDMRYADRIFEIFQRLHHGDQYAGTGIGLAICKRIVERHGGRIRVDSTPGRGASFHFTLFGRAPG